MFRSWLLKEFFFRGLPIFSALTVAVATAVLLLLGWMKINKEVHDKLQNTIATVQKKIEMPVSIGRWRLGLGNALIEEISVGHNHQVVIAKAVVELDLNPFSKAFAAIDSITIHRVRVKSDRREINAFWQKVPAYQDPKRVRDHTSPLRRLFAVLPVARELRIRSARVVVVDEEAKPLLVLRRAQVSVDKRKEQIEFRCTQIKALNDVSKARLVGYLRLKKQGDRYSFRIARISRQRAHDWELTGTLIDDLSAAHVELVADGIPSVFDGYLKTHVRGPIRMRLQGSAHISRINDRNWRFDSKMSLERFEGHFPLLNSAPIVFHPTNFHLRGIWQPQDGIIKVRTGVTVARSPFHQLHSQVSLHAKLPDPESGLELSGRVVVPPTACQAFLHNAPHNLLKNIAGFKLSGTAAADFEFNFHSFVPENFEYKVRRYNFGCQVQKAPYNLTKENLTGRFSIERFDRTILVDPSSRSYTEIHSIAKNVGKAMTAAEDISFWRHKGIDKLAIEQALRRNLTERRVAVGGSTITMQMVKNLLLTHERTISRKLQELFLAWYMERTLSKARILEIYLNIIEFGPELYGITDAAEHFFGRHPFDLSLKEAAYLATLLPNPKKRYRHFCQNKMTKAFRELHKDLLRRMYNLNHITAAEYRSALNSDIRFNQISRTSSDNCRKRLARTDPS